jgi:deoxyribodipyrimidine photo-lyase
MITASFLSRDLMIDYRRGEAWFMKWLVDGDWANNNAGWQWSFGCGLDAQPWFRVFSPVLQGAKFDPTGAYVRRWVPELARVPLRWLHRPWLAPKTVLREAGVRLGSTYPRPVVDHAFALQRFKSSVFKCLR